jgi:hypothetical protein
MSKIACSKVFKMSSVEVKKLQIRGNPNTPYARTLALRVGEAFVVYNKKLEDLGLPYSQAKKLGIKFTTKSNFRYGDKKGTLIARIR